MPPSPPPYFLNHSDWYQFGCHWGFEKYQESAKMVEWLNSREHERNFIKGLYMVEIQIFAHSRPLVGYYWKLLILFSRFFDTGERRQVLLHKLMENSFFYSKIIDHRTNKNIADDNCLEITFNFFWNSMGICVQAQFSYFASNNVSPHTRYRMECPPYISKPSVWHLTV